MNDVTCSLLLCKYASIDAVYECTVPWCVFFFCLAGLTAAELSGRRAGKRRALGAIYT